MAKQTSPQVLASRPKGGLTVTACDKKRGYVYDGNGFHMIEPKSEESGDCCSMKEAVEECNK